MCWINYQLINKKRNRQKARPAHMLGTMNEYYTMEALSPELLAALNSEEPT